MIKGKIEKGVPIPSKTGSTTPFYVEIIGFLDQLEIGDSVLFEIDKSRGYNFTVKLSTLIRIYCIIKKQELVSQCDDNHNSVRVWRIK